LLKAAMGWFASRNKRVQHHQKETNIIESEEKGICRLSVPKEKLTQSESNALSTEGGTSISG